MLGLATMLCVRSGTASAGADALPTTEAARLAPGAVVLPKLRLASPVGGALVPFTVGQPLRQGDVPAGQVLVSAGVPELQCVVRNRWPDGSAKFAVISGRVNMKPRVPVSIDMRPGPAPAPGAAVALAGLQALGLQASIDFGPFGRASWSAADWDRPVLHGVSGSQMSSWAFRRPVGRDAHLVAWLEVRLYKGGHVEVLPWIENGYLNVPGSGEKSGVATFILNGAERFSQPLTLLNHQRAVLAGPQALTHWSQADPQVTPAHDTAYFIATRLVPHYAAVTPDASVLFKRLPTEYAPLMQGSYSPAMGMAGYHPSLGLLPEWDAAYLTTGADPRAYRSVLFNGYAAGRFGIHYRDEKTQRPLAFASHPNLTMAPGSGVGSLGGSSTRTLTPAPSGGMPPQYVTSHHPSLGYMAYLVSGWHYFVEEAQFAATANYLRVSDNVRGFSKGLMEPIGNQTRGAGWALRTLSQAAAITPDDDPLRAQLVASLDANVEHYHRRYIAGPSNPLGLVEPYSNYNKQPGPYQMAIWMEDFLTASFGHMRDLAAYSPALQAKLDAFLAWKYRSVVGRLGAGGESDFPYPHAAQYTLPYAPSGSADWVTGKGPWYASWGEVARIMQLPTGIRSRDPLASGYPTTATAYWGSLLPALAYAVDHGAQDAAEAWARVRAASNFQLLLDNFNDSPGWGITPRARNAPALPAHAAKQASSG